MTTWFVISAFVAGAAALGLAALLLWKNRWSSFNRSVASALAAGGLIQIGNGLALMDASHVLFWRRLALLGELAQPVTLLYVGLSLMSPTASGENSGARWRARGVGLLASVFVTLAWSDIIFMMKSLETNLSVIVLGSFGRAVYVFILLSLALGIAQLESILRLMHEPLRYQLKFVLIGLGALAGYEIYEASQFLLVRLWQPESVLVGSVISLISVGLVAFGLGRYRLQEVKGKIYVSPQMLYGSVTFVVTGLYLLGVGLLGEIVRLSGHPLSISLSALVVFIGTIGLVVLLSSRTVRAELKKFIAKHFYRSKYDYRAKWLEVTEAFQSSGSVESILEQLMGLLTRTFGAGRISIWMRYEADGRFHQVRSANTEPAPSPLDASHPVILRLMTRDEPIELDPIRPNTANSQKDHFGDATQARLCVPIRIGNELTAFVALSRELHGERYGADDCDLLRAISHHVGVLLSQASLAEERRAAAELDALHRFSAFCLHDLKNLTARLSLVAQNADVYGHDPSFQESAMQTLAGTVKKMMALMAKLSLKSAQQGVPEPVDVQEVIAETVKSLNGALPVSVETAGERVPPVLIVREQLQQVLLNLILNAGQAFRATGAHAGAPGGAVRITTQQVNGFVVVTVADTGPGIEPEKLRTLFQPFRTTKEGGLGIGLFQCKRILEAHRGTIHVEREVGRGTSVRIELPVAPTAGPSIALSSRRGNHANYNRS